MPEDTAGDRPGFAVASGERVSDAIGRVLDEDLRWIAAALGGSDPGRVHDCRRLIKRCRALLRALGRVGPPEAARSALREAGAALGRIRDRQVRGAMMEEFGLASGPEAGPAPSADDAEAFTSAAAAVDRARSVLVGLAVGRGRHVIDDALVAAMKRQEKAFRRARSTRTTEDLHRWRKALQQLTSLCAFAGDRLRRSSHVRRHAARAVALLGDDHDLALLAETPAPKAPADLEERRARLQRNALREGRRLARLGAPSLRRRR